MLKITLLIPEDSCAYVQRHGFELDARKRIVSEIILNNNNNASVLEGESFKRYHDKYQESSVAFELAKSELELKHIPLELKQADGITNWELDYASCTMTITHTGNSFDNDYEKLDFAVPAEYVTVEVVSSIVPKQCGCGGMCE